MPALTIAIYSTQNKEQLVSCLDSIRRETKLIDYEIIVVSEQNNSGIWEEVKKRFPEVKLIEKSKASYNYAANQNLAIKQAQGHYIMLLNDDTYLVDDAGYKMAGYLDKHDEVGIIAPQLLNADLTIQPSCYLEYFTLASELLSLFFVVKLLKRRFAYYDNFGKRVANLNKTQEVVGLMGACLMVKQELFEKIGLLDERFFAYDDGDICLRALKSGWKNVYYPEAQIVHYGHQTIKGIRSEGVKKIQKSKRLFIRKHRGLMYQYLWSMMVLLGLSFQIVFFLVSCGVAIDQRVKWGNELKRVWWTIIASVS